MNVSAPILGTGEYSNYTITKWGELGVVDKSLVPAELVEQYKEADNWSNFPEKIEKLTEED